MEGKVVRQSSSSMLTSTVGTLSSKIFPNIDFDELSKLPEETSEHLHSSLPLQMVLFFSGLYFPAWLATTGTILYVKYWHLTSLFRYVVTAVYVALPPLEAARLNLAYTGNVHEKVPELAGSWLVVILLQLPLLLFVVFVPGCLQTPMDYPLHAVYLTLLLLHLVTAHRAITSMASYQAKLYQLRNLLNTQPQETNSSSQ